MTGQHVYDVTLVEERHSDVQSEPLVERSTP